MMKKVLYGVSMALLALVAIGSLQSCKDDLSDFKHEYAFDQTQLGQQIDALDTRLTTLEGEFATKIPDLEKRVKTNEGNIADLQALVATLADQATVNQIRTELDALKTDFEAYKTGNNAKIDAIETGITEINANIDKLNETVADHESRIAKLETGLNDANANITKLLTDVATQAAQIEAIQTKLGELDAALDNKADKTALNELAGKVDDLEADLNKKLTDLGTTVNDIKTALEAKDDELEGLINDLTDRVDELDAAVKEINKKLDFITDRLDKQITGILLQGTDNPLFGNFSLPIGVKSNMLFNWYGYNGSEDLLFPNVEPGRDAEGAPISEDVLKALGITAKVIAKEGENYGIGTEKGINLGKVYLTINPTTADFEGAKFKLETSDGKALPFLAEVKKSNDRLAFGYTSRAEEAGNGFYESDVIMPFENVEDCNIALEEGLKTAAKNALNDKSKRNAVSLLKAIYDQMNGLLPAYAVRSDWSYTNTLGEVVNTAVLSQYDLAVATAQPLGYKFLADKHSSKKLPTYGSVDNFLDRLENKALKQFNISNKKITISDHEIYFKEMPKGQTNIDIAKDENSSLAQDMIVTVSGLMVGDTEVEPFTARMWATSYHKDIWANVDNAIAEQIFKVLQPDAYWNDPDQYDLRVEIVTQVGVMTLEQQKQIQEAFDSVIGRAEDAVSSAFDKVQKYSDRLQQMVDLYNKVANKINAVAANPNAYLQVAAFYTTATNVDILSSNPAQPTPFDITTGKNICLYLSSYTGEIIAPAYKKFVAITKVGDAADMNTLAKANKNSDLNKVLDGTALRVNIPTANLEKGKVYEITYQAADFRGNTSTRKFYIQVI